MDQDRFNRDMDQYLREQRRKQEHGGVERKSVMPESVIEDDFGAIWTEIKSWFVLESEPVEEEDDEPREELTAEEMQKLEQELEDEQGTVEESNDEPTTDIDDLDVPQPSFLDRLYSILGLVEEPFEEIEEFDPEMYAEEESDRVVYEEDVKELMQICHRWIDELPPETKKAFKESDDFERYRELLDKLELLKK
jgi:hypothetical protein